MEHNTHCHSKKSFYKEAATLNENSAKKSKPVAKFERLEIFLRHCSELFFRRALLLLLCPVAQSFRYRRRRKLLEPPSLSIFLSADCYISNYGTIESLLVVRSPKERFIDA